MDEAVTEFQVATIPDRVFARIVDNLVLVVPSFLLFGLLQDMRDGVRLWKVVLAILLAAVDAAYEIVLVARRGQTVGKRFVELRVEPLAGGVPSWAQATIRYLVVTGVTLSGPFAPVRAAFRHSPLRAVPLLLTVGLLWSAAADDRKRGWHDKLAGTVVVDTGKPAP